MKRPSSVALSSPPPPTQPPPTLSTPSPDLYVILGGCSRRERAGAAEYVSASGGGGEPAPLWVLSPARKHVASYTSAPLCVPAERLRIVCASVDTVSNFTEHADEIRRCCGGRGGRVTIYTCPQHVARARAVARIVLGSRGLSVEVEAPAAALVPACAGAAEEYCADCDRKNGQEGLLRTLRDAVRAACWVATCGLVDGAWVADVLHSGRHGSLEERSAMNYAGACSGVGERSAKER